MKMTFSWGLGRSFAGWTTIKGSLSSLFTLLLLLPQDGADAVNVSGHYSQCHITMESIDAMIRAHVEPVHLECVNRRFHRRVRAPGFDERLGLLRGLRLLREPALSRQCHQRQLVLQGDLILWRMKTLVEAAGIQMREALFGFFHHRHRHLIIRFLFHHLMMQ